METEREMGEKKQTDYFTENMQESSHIQGELLEFGHPSYMSLWEGTEEETEGKYRKTYTLPGRAGEQGRGGLKYH